MQKQIISGALVCALLVGGYFMMNSFQEGKSMKEKKSALITMDNGLQYLVITEPKEGAQQAKSGNRATVHYSGWLYDADAPEMKGKKFDSSVDRGEPFKFNLGAGMVIRGWDEGVAQMKVGEKRRFVLPPQLAYGNRGVGAIIPANATLVFDVELLKLD